MLCPGWRRGAVTASRRGSRVRADPRASRGRKVKRGRMAPVARWAPRGCGDLRGSRAFLDLLVSRESEERLDLLERLL